MQVDQFKYRWLYKFAWGFEGAAALTGLAMAAVFNAPSYIRYSEDGIDATEWTFLIGGSLPFIMVAFAELCKIPLVTATIQSKTQSTRLIFGLTTFAAAFITFETVYNGLEQTQAQRSTHIFEYNAEIENLVNRIETIENRINVESPNDEGSLNRDIQEKRDNINGEFNSKIKQLDNEIKLIDKKYDDKLSSLISPIENQITEIKSEQGQTTENQEKAISQASKDIDKAQRELKSYETKLSKCGAFSSSCKKLNRDGIETTKKKINTLERKRDRLVRNNKVDNSEVEEKLLQIQNIRKEIQNEKDIELKVIEKKKLGEENWLKEKLSEIDQELKQKTKTVNLSSAVVSKAQSDKDAALNEIDDLKRDKALAVNANLVYRLAGRWFGVPAGDVTEAQAGVIGRIWSGSIAAIVAIMGPMIASAYLVLNNQGSEKPKSVFRALAKAINAKKRKPTIVEKKVVEEVEKIVEKEVIVEKIVEVEIEKPVIKHVPIFTDDPKLVELSKDRTE